MEDKRADTASRKPATLRPRDAAAIILVDRSAGSPRVLMGRRSSKHVFMPDTYVFPGGKRDASDHALPFSTDLHPEVMEKLRIGPPAHLSPTRVRALALAALRELKEETSLAPQTQVPDLSCLCFAARAITPPGRVRRYDTRFFLAFADEAGVDISKACDSDELLDLRWLDMEGDLCLNMPGITRTVLTDVKTLLANRPSPIFSAPVPFYRTLHGRAVRDFL